MRRARAIFATSALVLALPATAAAPPARDEPLCVIAHHPRVLKAGVEVTGSHLALRPTATVVLPGTRGEIVGWQASGDRFAPVAFDVVWERGLRVDGRLVVDVPDVGPHYWGVTVRPCPE